MYQLKTILTPSERQIFSKLNSPIKIQNFLDSLPINFELDGETYMSPRRVLKDRTAHCFEAALLAAAALAYHGNQPLMLDLRTSAEDEDHVVALFKEGNFWGAISKTNHAVLRFRDAVYRSPRELALSYFHEYFLSNGGKKTLREYSRPFNLSRFAPETWITAAEELFWLVEALDDSPHYPIASATALRKLRNATSFEIQATNATEWKARKRH